MATKTVRIIHRWSITLSRAREKPQGWGRVVSKRAAQEPGGYSATHVGKR